MKYLPLSNLSLFVFLGCAFLSHASSFQAPIDANVSDETFRQWQSIYNENQGVIKKLLKDANLAAQPPEYLNSLVQEASPYLLRHAVNPIDWRTWPNDQVTKNNSNSLIFLSIGYSTCHWCHVMEKESFIDLEVASFLNKNFQSIKIDRELSPYVDHYFTEVLTLIKGSAGWPINAILTPEGQVIWIDSYLPKNQFLDVLKKIYQSWLLRPAAIKQVAKNISQQIAIQSNTSSEVQWDSKIVQTQFNKWLKDLDLHYGGFKGQQKFPSEPFLMLALEHYTDTKDPNLARYLDLHLNNLMSKGLRDHIFGGFFRYSTDETWGIPHFEKMLYNQAQLISVFSRASSILKKQEYLDVAIDTYNFTSKFLHSEQQGFYSAIDADFKGKEGGYYLFSKDVISELPTQIQNNYVWQHVNPVDAFVSSIKLSSDNGAQIRAALVNSKKELAPPHIDKKQIAAWNALMITALIELYNASANSEYLDDAVELSVFIEEHLHAPSGALNRAYFNNQTTGNATFEDYSYLAAAYIGLYEHTFISHWKKRALSNFKQALRVLDRDPSVFKYVFKDTELISPLSALLKAGYQLSRYEKSIENELESLKNLTHEVFSQDISSSFSLLRVFDNNETDLSLAKIFARGHGFVKLVKLSDSNYELQVKLDTGWHINSNTPNQASLLATQVVSNSNVLEAQYPEPSNKTLGFDPNPLSLFTGEFSIGVDLLLEESVALKLQACNERLCLMPEKIVFNL